MRELCRVCGVTIESTDQGWKGIATGSLHCDDDIVNRPALDPLMITLPHRPHLPPSRRLTGGAVPVQRFQKLTQ